MIVRNGWFWALLIWTAHLIDQLHRLPDPDAGLWCAMAVVWAVLSALRLYEDLKERGEIEP